jgi:hypothetical protein
MDFPLWFVVPQDKTQPALFESVDKMSAWLASRRNETYWNVHQLSRDSMGDILQSLRDQGIVEIYADLKSSPRNMLVADLVLELARK